jgi:CheY-like chemotaxis protein
MNAAARHCILVVEDDAPIRDALVELLRASGADARGVENGRAAVQLLRDNFPACAVVLDLDMPVMNGWSFMDVQREDPRLAAIPVFIVTGVSDPQQEARRVGARAGFHKGPRVIEQLLAALGSRCPRHATTPVTRSVRAR